MEAACKEGHLNLDLIFANVFLPLPGMSRPTLVSIDARIARDAYPRVSCFALPSKAATSYAIVQGADALKIIIESF